MEADRLYGLIGYPISHSFSKKYFSDKFLREEISNARYELFPLEEIEHLPALLSANEQLRGLNVTIPYKESVLTYLDEIDDEASEIGAVNTIAIKEGRLLGYNTDVYGFATSLVELLGKSQVDRALVLGSGGASKAVSYVLDKQRIGVTRVSRFATNGSISYESITKSIVQNHLLVINTTPLGMHPKENTYPNIPYEHLTQAHTVYDLVYNPLETQFMHKARQFGARTMNGLQMLELQAEKSWQIWQELK